MTGTLSNRLAAVGLAAALAFGLAPGAAASPTEKSELAPPAASVLVEATGKVKAKERKKNRTIKVEAKRLEAGRTYEVRRTGGGEALAEFTTNRKGKGKAKITEDLPLDPVGYDSRDPADGGGIDDGGNGGDDGGSGGDCGGGFYPYGDGDCGGDGGSDPGRGNGGYGYGYYYYPYPGYCPPDEEPRDDEPCSWHCVQVCDKETGEVVLECKGENGNGHGNGNGNGNGNGGGDCDIPVLEDFELGYADYYADDGSFASVVMQRYDFEGAPYDQFYFSLMVPKEMEDCFGWYEWTFYDVYADQDTGLPLGVQSVRDLAGRAFEIRDAAGTAFIAGSLPALESLGDIPIWYYPAGGDDGSGGIDDREPPAGEAAFTLWIAGDDGELVEAAEFRTYEVGLPDEPQPGEGDGTNTLPGTR